MTLTAAYYMHNHSSVFVDQCASYFNASLYVVLISQLFMNLFFFADFFGLAANVFYSSLEKKILNQSIGWVLTCSCWCCGGYYKVI